MPVFAHLFTTLLPFPIFLQEVHQGTATATSPETAATAELLPSGALSLKLGSHAMTVQPAPSKAYSVPVAVIPMPHG